MEIMNKAVVKIVSVAVSAVVVVGSLFSFNVKVSAKKIDASMWDGSLNSRISVAYSTALNRTYKVYNTTGNDLYVYITTPGNGFYSPCVISNVPLVVANAENSSNAIGVGFGNATITGTVENIVNYNGNQYYIYTQYGVQNGTSLNWNSNPDMPLTTVYPTIEDAIEQYLIDSGQAITYDAATFTVPAGYVAVAKVPNDSITVDLSEVMPQLSSITGNPWPNIVQYIGTLDAWPVNGDSINVSQLSDIAWEKGDNRNLLGQTKQAEFSHTVPGYGKYYVIYNPAYYIKSLTGTDPAGINNTITVNINRTAEVRLYSVLQGSINGVETNTISDNGFTLVDNNWTDNGVPVNPETGGGNYVPDDTDLSTVLSGLLRDIDSFFSGTWRYIRQFVTAAGKLPSMVVEMYSWLPAEFRSVIFSAFSIVMVIGILKVML